MASSWRRSSSAKPSVQLLGLALVAVELVAHAVALALERLAQLFALALAAVARACRSPPPPARRRVRSSAAAARQRRPRTAASSRSAISRDGWLRAAPPSASREQLEALGLGVSRVRAQRPVAPVRVEPPRGDCDQLLVQPLGALAIKRQAPEQDHPRDRVARPAPGRRARGRGGRTPATRNRAEQPLRDPLLEVQVDGRRR